MSVNFSVTNPVTGVQKELALNVHPQEALKVRHEEGLTFYNKDKDKRTMATVLGLDYMKLADLRRSQEFDDEVGQFIADNELQDGAALRKQLGVMEAEVKTRDSSNGSITKKQLPELGEKIVNLVTEWTEPLNEEDTHLTAAYVADVIENRLVKPDELEPLPIKPVRPVRTKKSDREQDLEAQIEAMKAQMREAGVPVDGDDEDEEDEFAL